METFYDSVQQEREELDARRAAAMRGIRNRLVELEEPYKRFVDERMAFAMNALQHFLRTKTRDEKTGEMTPATLAQLPRGSVYYEADKAAVHNAAATDFLCERLDALRNRSDATDFEGTYATFIRDVGKTFTLPKRAVELLDVLHTGKRKQELEDGSIVDVMVAPMQVELTYTPAPYVDTATQPASLFLCDNVVVVTIVIPN